MINARILIGIGLGLALGALVGQFLKSRGGTCPLTCNPLGGALFGAALGFLIAHQFSSARDGLAAIADLPAANSPDDFQRLVVESDKVVLVDFYATWCGPCKRLAPTIGELADDMGDQVDFVKVDIDEAGQIARDHQIQGVPTIVLYSGGRIVDRWSGIRSRDDIRSALVAALAEHTPPPAGDDVPDGADGTPETPS